MAVTNVLSIPENIYTTVQNYIIEQFREKYPAGLVPVENVDGEPYVHRIPYTTALDVGMRVKDWNAMQVKAEAVLSYLDVNIYGNQLLLNFTSRDLRASGEWVINAKTNTIIKKFLDEVDHDVFHGQVEGEATISTGLLAQATSATDIAVSADSVLDSAADILEALKHMVTAIDPKYRDNQIVIMIMDHTLAETAATTFIGDSSVSVLQAFENAFPYVHVVRNNKAVLASGDTAGTNSRILTFVQNIDLVRLVKAKEISPVGPGLVDLTGAISQLWGTLWAVKVIDALAVYYSEQIVYS